MDKVSPELDYSAKNASHSTVVYRNVSTQGASSFTLTPASTVGPVEMIIPPSVFNPAKSNLNMTLVVPAQGATLFSHVSANGLAPINRIVLYDAGTSAVWADISNVHQYAEQVKGATSVSELLTKNGRQPSAAIVTEANALLQPVGDMATVKATSKTDLFNGDAAAQAPITGLEYRYTSAANTAQAVRYCIPLSAFKFSALAVDKMLYSPTNLVVQVYFNSLNTYAVQSDDTADATSNAADIAGVVTMSDISLSLANENNLAIVSQVINKVTTEGLNLPVGYVTTSRQSIASSTAHSYQINLSSAYGGKILGLISTPFSSASRQALKHDKSNITSYNTFLDNIAIRYPAGLSVARGEDWCIGNKHYFKDSAIQNMGVYSGFEWNHVDSFFGDKPLHEVDTTVVDGLDLTGKMATFQLRADLSAGTALTWVTTILGQKVLALSSAGSQIV